ncbi:MAG: TRAP transporter substrate-binding protein [Pseudomonadota bacterium]|nr:TRAP transporter substrate-binding protein [Pseudomonadota bacterium]
MTFFRNFGVASVAALCLSTTSAQALDLRFNNWLPPTHHLMTRVLLPYFEQIEEVTEGRVTVELTNSSLGGMERQYELAETGVADITLHSPSITPGQFPLDGIVEMPGISENPEAVSVAYWRTYEEYFAATDPYHGVHLLSLATLPAYHIYNAKRPVASIDDLDGLQLRAAGIISSEKVEALGATVIPAQITQFLELISKGVIDGAYYSDDGVYAFGFLDSLKYKTEFDGGLGGLATILVMNESKWEQISPEDQAAITEISGEAFAKTYGASMRQSVAEAQAAMEEAGIETTIADEAFMAEVRERLAPLEAEWIESANEAGVDGAAALEMIRSEAASYAD